MRSNKLKVTPFILAFVLVFSTSCNRNKNVHLGEQTNTENNKPPVGQNISSEEKIPPKPDSSASDKTPAPKSQPKKEVPKKTPPKNETSKNTIISSFSTAILDGEENRVYNISLASKKINGFVLNPGEIFSFNNVVGKRSYENGYKKSRILVNGEADTDVGGGICQLSSTIYNAAKKLNLEILERHNHSGEVHYIPKGQDAAVSYGYKDLKFKNTKSYPIKFITTINNGKVNVSLIRVK